MRMLSTNNGFLEFDSRTAARRACLDLRLGIGSVAIYWIFVVAPGFARSRAAVALASSAS